MGKYKIVFSDSGLLTEIREHIRTEHVRLIYHRDKMIEEKKRNSFLFEDL